MEEKIQSVQYRDSEPSEFAHKPPKQEMDLSCSSERLSPIGRSRRLDSVELGIIHIVASSFSVLVAFAHVIEVFMARCRCPSSNCFRQFKRGGRGSDAGRGSRRRDLHPKGDVCAGHKLASDIRWLYLLLAACAPVHAPLTRGHRLPPGTSGPSGSPGGARP